MRGKGRGKMSPREAFRVFIRFQLKQAVEEGHISLSNGELENVANDLEDDPAFYSGLNEFLVGFIEDHF